MGCKFDDPGLTADGGYQEQIGKLKLERDIARIERERAFSELVVLRRLVDSLRSRLDATSS